MLQQDHEVEVRVATAMKAAGVSAVLGADLAKAEIFPVVKDLVLDPNAMQRFELAGEPTRRGALRWLASGGGCASVRSVRCG